ncbi:MAG TPA: PAS domain S-box protein [Burkholderiales bacterium]|nr:PAS domain S-box protein [Burkholderiales bacterium]
MHLLSRLLPPSSGGFTPGGQSELWDGALMWLDASADLVIGAAYLLLSLFVLWCYRRRSEFPLRRMCVPLVALLLVGVLTQWFDVFTLWVPAYWTAGGVKAVAALVSLAAAVGFVSVMPRTLRARSTEPLEPEQCLPADAEEQRLQAGPEGRGRTSDAEPAAAAPSEAGRWLHALVEYAPEAIIVLDLALDRFCLVNENACRLFGLPRSELLRCGWIELSAPVQPDGSRAETSGREQLQAAARGENPVFEWTYRDGQARDVVCETRLTCLPSPYASLLRASIVDIGERKRVETALRESEAKYLTVFRTCPGSLSISNREDGRYLEVNDAYERLFEYSRQEVIGRSALQLGIWVDPTDRQRLLAELARSGRVHGFEASFRRKDGAVWLGELSAETAGFAGTQWLVVALRDVSRQRQAEHEIRVLNAELEQRVQRRTAELEAANHELESFSYSVSHDLRTPVRSIQGFAQALLDEYGAQLPEPGKCYLRRIRGATERMAHLIDDLLKLARVARLELVAQPVDLTAMAREVIEQRQSVDRQRHVEAEIEEGLVAHCDARLMRVVLENLIDNAWKFTSQTPTARIEFGHKPGSGDVFRVQDNGAGFDVSLAHKLFVAFQRLHAADDFPGTGIGLATVQRIIHRHGGRIWAEGSIGHGASFLFTLGAEKDKR